MAAFKKPWNFTTVEKSAKMFAALNAPEFIPRSVIKAKLVEVLMMRNHYINQETYCLNSMEKEEKESQKYWIELYREFLVLTDKLGADQTMFTEANLMYMAKVTDIFHNHVYGTPFVR